MPSIHQLNRMSIDRVLLTIMKHERHERLTKFHSLISQQSRAILCSRPADVVSFHECGDCLATNTITLLAASSTEISHPASSEFNQLRVYSSLVYSCAFYDPSLMNQQATKERETDRDDAIASRREIVDSSTRRSRKILCVGRTCVDVVYTCTHFPSEDSTQRSVEYRWQRGGNASNTCTVLSLLNQPCELLACLSAKEHVNFLQNDLRKYGIDYSHCPMIEGIDCPIATILLSLSTGTRTIVYHNQNLPELTLKDFQRLNLGEYSWIHFEGRNTDQVLLMIQRIKHYNNLLGSANRVPITISVELESPRSERLLDLLPHVDVAFVAKDFAKTQGLNSMHEVVQTIDRDNKLRGNLICAWGEDGAIARTACGVIVTSPAYPPERVIDTLGAGDTFNAAVLYYLNRSKAEFMHKYEEEVAGASDRDRTENGSFEEDITVGEDIEQNSRREVTKYNRIDFVDKTILHRAIKFACCIAGAKVGLRGYDCLDKISNDILQQEF